MAAKLSIKDKKGIVFRLALELNEVILQVDSMNNLKLPPAGKEYVASQFGQSRRAGFEANSFMNLRITRSNIFILETWQNEILFYLNCLPIPYVL